MDNTAFKDSVVIAEAIHPGQSFGDYNETVRDPNTRSWLGIPTNPCATAKFVSRNVEFEIGQDNSPKSARGGMVHKMKWPWS